MQFEDVTIKCPKQFLYYIEFICRRASEKNSSLKFCVFGWFPGLQNLDVFFGKFTVGQVLKSFSGTNDTLKPPVFGFCDSLPFGLENQESLEL